MATTTPSSSTRRAMRAGVALVAVSSIVVLLMGPVAEAWRVPGFGQGRSSGVAKPVHAPGFLGRFSGTPSSLGPSSASCPSSSAVGPLSAATMAPPTLSPEAQRKKDAVAAYVKSRGGDLAIRKVLIANNGMAATKSILSMRQWAYMELGDDRAIEFVVMATPEDLNANAEFIRLADRFVEVPGGSNKNNYANVDLIVQMAQREGVDAVWPGWGHASENPRLPNTLKQLGIKFIGPTGPVMSVLGDKIAANILAQTAKVPSIPWSGDGLTAELTAEGTIPDETFQKAMVRTSDEALAAANRIGYPVMLKASEGGGGKGIRMSNNDKELETNFVQVQNEVPGSPMFMMQLCTQARHIEVQIVGDEHGNAAALNGRDCSTQRRFQKIFEEGPPTIVPPEVFKQMELAAQRLTQSIGYIGAGTVEYLFNAATGKYFFLELNPRLQVEHPVTEGLSLVNLPATQLQIAMGIPLNRIPDIRRFYGKNDPYGDSSIDFFNDDYAELPSHVIAARITAENPDEHCHVWGYFSVGANGGIHEYADSQFGHLFAKGNSREDARKSLVLALKEIEVRGDIRTTVEYLVQLLETEAFKENTIDTSWLDGLIREKSVRVELNPYDVALSAAIARAFARSVEEERKFVENLSKGQVAIQGIRSINSFPMEITYKDFKYTFHCTRVGLDKLRLAINDQILETKVRQQPDGSLIAEFGGTTHTIYALEEPLGLRMVLDGVTVLLPTVYDPSELRTDVTGKIVRYLQDDGAEIQAGQPYVEVEAMKMIMPLKATESGTVAHRLSPGSIITAGDLLANVQLKDPSKVKKITPFKGALELVGSDDEPGVTGFDAVFKTMNMVLDGYDYEVEFLAQNLVTTAQDGMALLDAATALVNKYLAVEEQYAGKVLDEAMVGLVKANKDSLSAVLALATAHRELPRRNKMVAALIRQLQALVERSSNDLSLDALITLLDRASRLPGKEYGEVAISSAQALLALRAPPFSTRQDELRATLLNTEDNDALARSATITAGVDLLTAMFTDPDAAVRKNAIEVYIRRIYRAHRILSLSVEEVDGVMVANWSFKFADTPDEESPLRLGFFTVFPSLEAYTAGSEKFSKVLKGALAGKETYAQPTNVFHVAVAQLPESQQPEVIANIEGILAENKDLLTECRVRMVNVLFVQGAKNPRYFTFTAADNFKEDPLRRDMRPTFPQLLELSRLAANYELQRLPSIGRNTQVYLGSERAPAGTKKRGPGNQVLFVRGISHSEQTQTPMGAERVLLMAMDELDYALLDERVGGSASSRLFLNLLVPIDSDPKTLAGEWSKIMDRLLAKYATRLLKLGVDEIEIKVRVAAGSASAITPVRLMASSMTGEFLRTDAFLEYPDPVTGITKQFCSITSEDQVCLLNPYPASNSIQTRRASARRIGSTYAYDFLGVMEVSLIQKWDKHLKELSSVYTSRVDDKMPEQLFQADELVLEEGLLRPTQRLVGLNDVGMVAWHATMKTPEYPEGRELIIIANDVTFQSGSFGVKEDDFFRAASEYARVRGLPRIYLSSNSGARIGLVDDLKGKFRIAWNDAANPSLGFKYLYLTPEEYEGLKPGTVNANLVVSEEGEKRWALQDIIGQVHGIGVENLRGSGMIAGETSRAYDETFTLSYVTGRSVGIGAYLVRLGQRTIQMVNGPLILTGYSALNKLLGREVYTSQDQLGGPQIMSPNGVSHLVVDNDKEGISSIIDWLSFVPKDKFSSSPIIDLPTDSPDRDVEFQPTKTPYDPRHMLAGTVGPDGAFVPGFFDRDSFIETLGGWGKSVVTGRAKLGGIPMGIISVETRLVEQRIPADPANPESRESLLPQAGQVWYPDSAFKTAQAIEDFNRGENLPLMIFANWRGFSGGTRDMYGEILKFGAKIVDALRTYRHPVFVYIPPNGELRGGAWVVIDPTINEEMMEMYADKDSRGGILEPPGICEVKFRAADQISAMHRLDPVIQALDGELQNAKTEADATKLKQQLKEREEALLPLYMQVAHEFADLHDRAGRMKAKGVIRDIVTWKRSRSYFYWRARRRIAEDGLVRAMQKADAVLSVEDGRQKLEALATSGVYGDDKAFVAWVTESGSKIEEQLMSVKHAAVKASLASLLAELSPEERKKVLAGL